MVHKETILTLLPKIKIMLLLIIPKILIKINSKDQDKIRQLMELLQFNKKKKEVKLIKIKRIILLL